MKLGIISDCVHYKTADGKVGTENHILLRQLQTLAANFTETLICCPFAGYDATKVVSEYTSANIQFTPVPVVGGDTLKAKLVLLRALWKWQKAYKKIDRFSDIIYQRFPNNLNIPGLFYFKARNRKVFATYTGTWSNYGGEPGTYSLQRWLLRNVFNGPVWAYTNDTTGRKIMPGFSPSYSNSEWNEEAEQVARRMERIRNEGLPVFKLITVGTLIGYKNQAGVIAACAILKQRNFPFVLTIVGDGPMRRELETLIENLNLQNEIIMAGKKTAIELRILYRQHDFVVQAPLSEGFGKVPVEGFFHGVVPVINNISMAGFMTGNGERGFLFEATRPQNLADTLIGIRAKTDVLPGMIEKGRQFAKSQTLETWAEDYCTTINSFYGQA